MNLDDDIAYLQKILRNIKETAEAHDRMRAALDRIVAATQKPT